MLSTYATLITAVLTLPPSGQNLLLLASPGQADLVQQVVHQALVQEALATPGLHVLASQPLPPAARRASLLRQKGVVQLAVGRQQLQTLRPEEAAATAAMATQKFSRVATLTGDVGPLSCSLALQAAALLHAGTMTAAVRVLTQLLALSPNWRPDASLFNPEMQRLVRQVRRRMDRLPRRSLVVDPGEPHTAVFVNGRYAGTGRQTLCVVTHQPVYLYALPATGEPIGDRLVPTAAAPVDGVGRAQPALPLQVQLAPLQARPHGGGLARYDSVLAAAATREGFVEPSLPALAAACLHDIWVLRCGPGTAELTRFDLQSGRRSVRRTAVGTADLMAAHGAARALLGGNDDAP